MNDREKLIKAAAKRLLNDVNPKRGRPASSQLAADVRTVAGAVFEKAHTQTERAKESDTSTEHVKNEADSSHATPTDDEREALARIIRDRRIWNGYDSDEQDADAILAAGFRRSEVPEPSADDEDRTWLRMDRETAEELAHSEFYLAWVRKQEPPLTSEEAEVAALAFAEAWRVARAPHAPTHSCTLCDRPEGSASSDCTCWCHPYSAEPQGEPSDAALDAAFAAFRAHGRGEEFNELGEHVCSECGYAYSWPSGIDGRQEVPSRRRQRHIAHAALRAAAETGGERVEVPGRIWLKHTDGTPKTNDEIRAEAAARRAAEVGGEGR